MSQASVLFTLYFFMKSKLENPLNSERCWCRTSSCACGKLTCKYFFLFSLDYSWETFSPGSENSPFLVKGSGSYPMMARTRTANRNKLSKRRSDTGIITGAYRTVPRKESVLVAACPRFGSTQKKKKLWSNKRSVHTKVSRRKSLENLGLLVRNRCGTAKIQWPSGLSFESY